MLNYFAIQLQNIKPSDRVYYMMERQCKNDTGIENVPLSFSIFALKQDEIAELETTHEFICMSGKYHKLKLKE